MNLRKIFTITLLLVCLIGLLSARKHESLFALSSNSNYLKERNQDYTLVWEDNFDSNTLDTSKWSKQPRTTANWAKHMTDLDELFEIKDSRLRLYCRSNNGLLPNDTATYLTAGVITYKKFTFTYGKVEVRAKIKGAQGCQPAIWIGGNSKKPYGGTEYQEIDVMEHVNNNNYVYQTVHNYYIDILQQRNNPPYQTKAAINTNEYNTYAVEILPEKLLFSVNGINTLTYPKLEEQVEGQYPFGTDEMFLILSTCAGSTWAGKVDPSQLPAYIDIDWVKVYSI